MSKPAPSRCAIYTRKSSEEGLDQAFNSLDAQREAGEAYIKSQACEGWRMIAARYDDGGYSGGTMERPGLQRLLADIKAGLIDVVVVYKIDRLTRSLADFARIVEQFDARSVSFVSVTQAFNTTSSMGRLTLNVLLSFAQFEREVTGERIRDKIAASKAKGMWMGGTLPLGYDLPAPGTRTLVVNQDEASTVRLIFARYLELGSVHRLQQDLAARGIVSKRRVSRSGRSIGGVSFSRGALFHLLRNRLYLGQIVHKDLVHAGAHLGLIDPALFEAVQHELERNRRRHGQAAERRVERAPLTGKLFDATGEAMSPTFSCGRGGRVYRYYVSTSLQQGGSDADDGIVRRVPAPAIETLIGDVVQRLMAKADAPLTALKSLHLAAAGIELVLDGVSADGLRGRLLPDEQITSTTGKVCRLFIPLAMPLRGGRRTVTPGQASRDDPDPVLIAALRKAHRMVERTRGAPVVSAAPVSPYDRKLLRLAFLAPDLQRDILAGRQPHHLNLEAILQIDLPLAWPAQRQALHWDPGHKD